MNDLHLPIMHHSFFYEPPYFPGYRDIWGNAAIARTAAHPWGAAASLAYIIAGGILDRYPNIKVGFSETGHGWLPYWLLRLDSQVIYVKGVVPDAQIQAQRIRQDGPDRVLHRGARRTAHDQGGLRHPRRFVPDVRLGLPASRMRLAALGRQRPQPGKTSSARRGCASCSQTNADNYLRMGDTLGPLRKRGLRTRDDVRDHGEGASPPSAAASAAWRCSTRPVIPSSSRAARPTPGMARTWPPGRRGSRRRSASRPPSCSNSWADRPLYPMSLTAIIPGGVTLNPGGYPIFDGGNASGRSASAAVRPRSTTRSRGARSPRSERCARDQRSDSNRARADPDRARSTKAIRYGNLVFTSGQAGRNRETGKMGDVADQARRCIANIAAILEASRDLARDTSSK